MRFLGPLAVIGLFVLSSIAVLGSAHSASGISPPSPMAGGSHGAGVTSLPSPVPRLAHAGASDLAPALAPHPSTSCVPNWNSVNFFNDVCVSFSQFGASAPPNLPIVPFVGNISMYVPAIYINITTNVPITAANVFLWGTLWQQNGTPAQSPPGFDPSGWNSTDVHPMELCSSKHAMCATPSPDSATYSLNLNKYFFPGSNVSFMIEVISASGTPTSTIWSYKTTNVTEPYPSGYVTYPTWEFVVDSPFASPVFENDIKIATVPTVLTQPAFFPNPTQKVQIIISSFSITGGALAPIPVAYAQYTINTKLQNG
ncbi:MAG: hypothetical protein L3J97_04725, partial [Thermoplasmata archaeon]|nr:hypothetical protein [Thermoplasmata archaeon]